MACRYNLVVVGAGNSGLAAAELAGKYIRYFLDNFQIFFRYFSRYFLDIFLDVY